MRDDAAYFLPMFVFLIGVSIGGHWPGLMPASYVARTIAAAALLGAYRKQYTKIRWNFWWLGILVGIVGVFQWIYMEKGILHLWPHYWNPSGHYADDAPNPLDGIASPTWRWTFLFFRLAGPVLVVPFMEELFWRDFLWRTILAPNNFKLASVGEWNLAAFTIVTLFFASVHAQWMTAIVWGAMIGLLLVTTRSLGACIIAHGVTNLLLGLYVVHTHEWWFW